MARSETELAVTERSGDADLARVRVSPRAAEASPVHYDVVIGPGVLDRLPELVRQACAARRYAILADSNVLRLYGGALLERMHASGEICDLVGFPAGEAHKTREVWADLSDRLLAAGLGRDSALLALGGGVTGDLGGFVAASYMRGLPYVQIPTTLLAMIDSSVGGKTGVDTPAGKNLIGAFHQPRAVLADTGTLRTLPPAEVRSGMAEAIKHGAIADLDYFDWIAASLDDLLGLRPPAMAALIRRSVEIKATVVGSDEREMGLRKTLNFGHTVGHAVEAASGFSLLHGEAIAIGMVVEAAIGEALGATRQGTVERLEPLLRAAGLPVAVPSHISATAILELTRSDKKARAGQVEYALIERIGTSSLGTGSYGTPVPDAAVLAAIEQHTA